MPLSSSFFEFGDRKKPSGRIPSGNITPIAAKDDARERGMRAARRLTILGEMTGGIVHDFRNILAVIEAGLRLAADNVDDPEKVRSCIAAMHDGVGRGQKMTSRLLAFASAEDFQADARNVNDLLRNLEIVLKYAAGPAIGINLQLDPAALDCRIEPSPFNAAILNLVINARDAMPGGGVIRISTKTVIEMPPAAPGYGAYLRVRVQDNGQGMPPEVRRRVFDRYFTTKGEAGTGLGIPQIRSFMKQVGGFIDVDTTVGVGTMFDLFFPIQESSPQHVGGLCRQIDRWVNEGGSTGDVGRSPDQPDGERNQTDPGIVAKHQMAAHDIIGTHNNLSVQGQ